MKISLNGYGENAATFRFTGLVRTNSPVSMSDNFTVKPSEENECIIGVALNKRDDIAAVQLSGYVQLDYSGTAPSVGICKLTADGNGGVAVNASGREYIVTDVNTVNGKVGFIL